MDELVNRVRQIFQAEIEEENLPANLFSEDRVVRVANWMMTHPDDIHIQNPVEVTNIMNAILHDITGGWGPNPFMGDNSYYFGQLEGGKLHMTLSHLGKV